MTAAAPWTCATCGVPTWTARKEPDGSYTGFCRAHIPDEAARQLDDELRRKGSAPQ